MTLYLTRHGRSMTNDDLDIGCKFKVDIKNNVLTREGVQQALDYGDWLLSQEADVHTMICSPYGRTKQTAFLIATALGTLVPIHYDRAFREIQWKIAGKWNRLLNEQLPDLDPKTVDIDFKPVVDYRRRAFTLESGREVYDRVIPKFAEVYRKHRVKGDVLVVTHYFVVRAINSFIMDGRADTMTQTSPRNLCQNSYIDEQVMEAIERVGL